MFSNFYDHLVFVEMCSITINIPNFFRTIFNLNKNFNKKMSQISTFYFWIFFYLKVELLPQHEGTNFMKVGSFLDEIFIASKKVLEKIIKFEE